MVNAKRTNKDWGQRAHNQTQHLLMVIVLILQEKYMDVKKDGMKLKEQNFVAQNQI